MRMVRGVIAAGMGLTMLLGASAARADEAPAATPATAGQAAAPQAAAHATAPAARPQGTVRLHVRSYKEDVPARLFVAAANGAYAFVCQAPCTADVYPGTPLRVTIGDSDEGHDFTMTGTPGNDVDLVVRPASKGPIAGGVVMLSFGGITALVGMVLAAAGAQSGRDGTATAGWICLGIGGGLTAGGIALIASRSREPRIRTNERAPSGATASRADLFSGDLASLRPPSPIAPAFAPLSFGGTF